MIKKAIRDLLKAFSEYPDIFLTENDACCYLFAILIKNNPRLLKPQKTKDVSFSIPIHSEIRWYGSSGKLRYLSDIVLLKPKDLRVKDRSSLRLPSKGYGFNSYYGIIEIKLRRVNGYSNNEFLNKIEKDIIKLKNIRKETKIYNKIKKPVYYLVCLDKKHDIRNDIEEMANFITKSKENIFLEYAFQKNERKQGTQLRDKNWGPVGFEKPTLKTSRRMKRVKSTGTRLEKTFASLLRKNGIKYQSQPKLFGKPDFRVKNTKILIFCDSSFWHGRRKKEITGEAFKVNRIFWREKLLYNKNKDKWVNRILRQRGWTVIRFWDDEILKHPGRVLKKLNKHVKTSK